MARELKTKVKIQGVDGLSAPIARASRSVNSRLVGSLRRAGRVARTTTRAISGVGRAAGRIGGVVGKLGLAGGAAAAGAAYGIYRIVDAYAAYTDTMAKLSRIIGFTAQQYEELKFAAGQAGVSAEGFDKSLKKFSKNLEFAKVKSGTLYEYMSRAAPVFLEQLTATRSSTEAFDLMAAAVAKVQDPLKRAALMQAAFGNSGRGMVLMLEQGVEGLSETRKEFVRLHGVIGDETREAEGFVDAQGRMKAAIDGVRYAIGARLTRTFSDMINQSARWVATNRPLFVDTIGGAIDSIVHALRNVDWKGIFISVKESIKSIVSAIKSVDWSAFARGAMAALGSVVQMMKDIHSLGVSIGWFSPGGRRVSEGQWRGIPSGAIDQPMMHELARGMGSQRAVPAAAMAGVPGDRRERWTRTPLENIGRLLLGDAMYNGGVKGRELTIRVESEPGTRATIRRQPGSGSGVRLQQVSAAGRL